MTVANSFIELMSLDGEEFVQAAYQLVLGRAPDEAGLAYYVARLRVGYSKLSVLNQLGSSGEPRSWNAIPGLDQAMRRYQVCQWPLIGWMLRRFWRLEGETVPERLQRAIISNLAGVRKDFRKAHAANAELERRLTAAVAAVSPSAGVASSDNKLPHRHNMMAEQLSPRARAAFDQLASR